MSGNPTAPPAVLRDQIRRAAKDIGAKAASVAALSLLGRWRSVRTTVYLQVRLDPSADDEPIGAFLRALPAEHAARWDPETIYTIMAAAGRLAEQVPDSALPDLATIVGLDAAGGPKPG
ncbi:hypothetical protein [Parafrankia discariae]|uniref:hypothetical protein n=1 Tax=Parafrankia discariae TaxID=365528 RepID=UPI0003A65E2E|nr:hypothetical protein [Parafrankia discariae]